MTRTPTHHYEDPLDRVWLTCAEDLGYKIHRTDEVYASFDGKETLSISVGADFDADDSLAQLILHELCHALVSAPEGLQQIDWGLDNTSDRDLVQEHATHRLQAHLADLWGLRHLFGVTTQWRPYWDALPDRPLEGQTEAAKIARRAFALSQQPPWEAPLRRAFARSAQIAALVLRLAPEESLWSQVSFRVHRRHPLGPALGPQDRKCGQCAWFIPPPEGADSDTPGHCLMLKRGLSEPPETRANTQSCIHIEPPIDDDACARCGACCHRAFHFVPVAADEEIVTARPDLVSPMPPSIQEALGAPHRIERPGGACVALEKDGVPYRCSVYAIRPQRCRDFEAGGETCLEARRRVHLSDRP